LTALDGIQHVLGQAREMVLVVASGSEHGRLAFVQSHRRGVVISQMRVLASLVNLGFV